MTIATMTQVHDQDIREELLRAFVTVYPPAVFSEGKGVPVKALRYQQVRRELKEIFDNLLNHRAYTDAAMMLLEPLRESGWNGNISLNGGVKLSHPTDKSKDVYALCHDSIAVGISRAVIFASGQ